MPSRFLNRGQRRRAWVLRHVPQAILMRPYELFLSGLCVLAGGPLLMGGAKPTTLEALLPDWLVRLWGAELVIGSVLVAYGLFRPRAAWERIGHTLLAPAAIVYGAAIITVLGPPGLVAGVITIAFGVAAAARAFVLRLAEETIREVLEEADSKWPGER